MNKRINSSNNIPNILFLLYLILFNITSYIYASENIDGTSNTLIITSKNPDEKSNEKTMYKLIEYFNISINKNQQFHFYFDGWTTGYLSKVDEDYYIPKNEISSAYFQYNIIKYPIYWKIGRFFLNEGIAKQEQIDGVYGNLLFKNDFQLTLYQGIETEINKENEIKDNLLYGGKISKTWGKNSKLSVSYLNKYDSSIIFRREMGFDLFYTLQKDTELLAEIDYNLKKERISVQDYILNYFVNQYLTIGEEYKKTYFKYVLPNTNKNIDIFSYLENEDAEKWKTYLDINSTGDYAVLLDYEAYSFNDQKGANSYGGEIRYRMLTENTYGVSFHRMYAGRNNNSYNEAREFFRIDDKKNLYSFDAVQVFYSQPIYKRKQAYQFMFTGGHYFKENVLLTSTVEYNLNSFYKYDLYGILKFKYLF